MFSLHDADTTASWQNAESAVCHDVARSFDDSAVQLWVESLFVFSVVWSVGATGDTDGREAFDTFFRQVADAHTACTAAQEKNPALAARAVPACLTCHHRFNVATLLSKGFEQVGSVLPDS